MDSSKWILCSIAMCWVLADYKVSAFNTFSDALEDLEDNVQKLQTMLGEMEISKRKADNGKCKNTAQMVGKWDMSFNMDYTPKIRIKREGSLLKISHINKADNTILKTVVLEPVDKGVFKGMFIARDLYRPTTWEYYTVKQGKLMVESFCGDGCDNVYQNKVDKYCCHGDGIRKGKAGANIDDIEGTWDQTFKIPFKEKWEVTSNGKVGPFDPPFQKNPKGLVNLEKSDSSIFPASDCWFMSRGTYRKATTEFYRLNNGKLVIRSFCTDGCNNVYKGKVGSKVGYCCGGIGDKKVPKQVVQSSDDMMNEFWEERVYKNNN